MTLDAPAKLNLSLVVMGKRPDGYHELNTIMVKLPGLADQVTFEPADEFSFSCDDPALPTDESNLVVKAVRAYETASGTPCRYRISLEKHVPHGAGLGGGSSDAATTLLGLNQLNGNTLSLEKLSEIAASLGSDIPFFLSPGAARCTGRGEIIKKVPPIRPTPVLLLKPSFGVSTQDAYGRFSDRNPGITGISYRMQKLPFGKAVNNLERPVFSKHRFLGELKQWLLERPETLGALMSGSGSTVFAVLKNPDDAEKVAAEAKAALDPNLWSWSGFTG